MINKIKRSYKIILLILGCFLLFPASEAKAGWFSLSSLGGGVIGSSMDSAFNKMGVDQKELQNAVKTFNVSRRKKQPPLMELSFDPPNPVNGQKVTVVSAPSYFFNDSANLYFTWYLKTNGCPEKRDPSPSEAVRKKCDSDGNSIIDINDYKVKAARILASNDFEWDKANYNSGTAGKSYKAIWGGDDQKEKGQKTGDHCFIHDFDSGDEYEIICDQHLFPETSSGAHVGNNDFNSLDYEEFFHTDPNDPDTADTGNGDEANVVGLGQNSFSWNYEEGDQVGVVVEGVSMEPTQYKDSTYKIMWAFVNNKCDLDTNTDEDYPDTDSSTGSPENIGTGETCPDGSIIQQKTTTTTKTEIVDTLNNTATLRTSTHKTDYADTTCNGSYSSVSADYDKYTTCPSTLYPVYDSDGNLIVPQNNINGFVCNGLDTTTDNLGTYTSSGKLAASSDINDCLYGNFADPAEGGGTKTKMDINLSYSPDFPMNDPGTGSTYNKSGDGDQLVIQSSVTNADNPGYLKYDWQLYEGDTPNADPWDSISKDRLQDEQKTSGVGLDSLKLKLNIPSIKKYLKVKVTVTENNPGSSATRKGTANVVIPVSKISQRIKAYGTSVSDSLSLSLKADEICLNGTKPDAVCYVAKNEIAGLSVSDTGLTDFLWTVNGNPIQPVSQATTSGNIAFLPILEDNSYKYSVELTATSSNGDKVDLVKTFQVADPEVEILSANDYVCKPNLLGHYVDIDGKYWPDYSKTNFSAVSGTLIKLQAKFNGINPSSDQYNWNVDGYTINKANAAAFGYSIDDQSVLTLSEKQIGEIYNVGVGLIYTQDNNTKKALSKYWGVQMNNFYEKKVGAAIKISFVGSISDTQGAGKDNLPKKIIASIFSSTPDYIAFLLRIVLTAFAMLIFSKIILSFFPNLNKNEY